MKGNTLALGRTQSISERQTRRNVSLGKRRHIGPNGEYRFYKIGEAPQGFIFVDSPNAQRLRKWRGAHNITKIKELMPAKVIGTIPSRR